MASRIGELVYIGIKGTVVALYRNTGEIAWSTTLKGGDFVNVILDGDRILAATKGELFCFQPLTGELLWHNQLKGYGRGYVSMVTKNAPGQGIATVEQLRSNEAAAASS